MRTNNLAENVLVQIINIKQQSEEVHEESKSNELNAVVVGDAVVESFRIVLDHISIYLSTCGGKTRVFGYERKPCYFLTNIGEELKNKFPATRADVITATGASCTQYLGDQLIDTSHLPDLTTKGFDR